MEYYGRFSPSALYPVLSHFKKALAAWAVRKYRPLKNHKTRASLFLEGIAKRHPHFAYFKKGIAAR